MLRELQTFLAVVRYGSFASAGANIGLTQSAVSAQIHRLEEELGLALFDRSGRHAVLNSAGYEALAVADEIMAAYSKLGRSAASSRAGLIRVGAISSAQASFLANALALFRSENPECRVRLVPGVSLNLLGQVDSGEVDMAVIIKPRFTLPADLQWRVLLSEPFFLLAPKTHQRFTWRALLESEPFIRYDRNAFDGRLVDQFLRRSKISVKEAIELDELQGIVQLVRRGAGVALLPATSALSLPKEVVALSLGEATFFREVGLVERPAHSRQPAANLLALRILEAAQVQACADERPESDL
jgi:DNA-binding transcriptional LysR family regulator